MAAAWVAAKVEEAAEMVKSAILAGGICAAIWLQATAAANFGFGWGWWARLGIRAHLQPHSLR